MKIFLISVILISFQFGCKINPKQTYMRSDLTNRTYSMYKGLSLFVRSYDEENNPIVFLHDYTAGFNVCGYKIFTARTKDSSILASNIRKFSDTCQINLMSVDSVLVKEFVGMKIRRLMVDNDGNIFISTQSLSSFDIVNLVSYVDSANKYNSWTYMGRNWYQKP